MKKRLHDKKAGIAILLALIIISVAEVIFRATVMKEFVFATENLGEQLIVIALAATILLFTAKGKDRACYILYGAWLACFIMNQVFGLPSVITNLIVNISNPGIISIIIRLLAMICIIAIGVLLVEYMNDGTIYNHAFNAFCIIAVLLLIVDISTGLYNVAFNEPTTLPNGIDFDLFKKQIMLDIFNKAYHVIMIFLFTFFAYDSAKAQLKKANLAK